MTMNRSRAVIFASFGVLDDQSRAATIDSTARDLSAAFPSLELRQALTSNFIRRRLIERGYIVKSLDEQIEQLRAEGFSEIIILPSHITPGEEFDQKIAPLAASDVTILPPLFTLQCDTAFDRRAFETIVRCFPIADDEELILIGHGSPHRHNVVYENLQRLADISSQRVHIGVIEPTDRPNFDDVIARLRCRSIDKILLAPLLFTSGSHVNEDIAGDDDRSWRNRLIDQGISVRVCTNGLGTFERFRQLYVDKLRAALT